MRPLRVLVLIVLTNPVNLRNRTIFSLFARILKRPSPALIIGHRRVEIVFAYDFYLFTHTLCLHIYFMFTLVTAYFMFMGGQTLFF